MTWRTHIIRLACCLLLAAVCTTSTSCARLVRPTPEQFTEIVKEYDKKGSVTLEEDGLPIPVDPGVDTSVLVVRRDCSWAASLFLQCDWVVTGPLEHWSYEEDDGKLKLETRNRLLLTELVHTERVDPGKIEKVLLMLDGDPAGQVPQRWAVGAVGGGPALLGGVGVQFLPFSWYAIELGGLPGPHFIGFAGMRWRMMRLGPIRPFVGGVVNMMSEPDDDKGLVATLGPRLGLDLELFSGRLAIGVEGDMLRFLTKRRELHGIEGTWIPYGGGSVYVFF